MPHRYRAFISHERRSGGRVAETLRRDLQRLGKPWWRRRAYRVFQAFEELGPSSGLATTLERAMDASEWFLLVATPGSAASPWVQLEVEHWLARRGTDHILLLVLDGELRWSPEEGCFDPGATTALPPQLMDAFEQEPLWADLREWRGATRAPGLRNAAWADVVAGISATLTGRSRTDIRSEELRQQRQVLQLAGAAVVALLVLLVTALGAAGTAVWQRQRAVGQTLEARRNLGRALVVEAGREHEQGALLAARRLAVAAVESHDEVTNRSALLTAFPGTSAVLRWSVAPVPLCSALALEGDRLACAGSERMVVWERRRDGASWEETGRLDYRAGEALAVNAELAVVGRRGGFVDVLALDGELHLFDLGRETEATAAAILGDGAVLVDSDDGRSWRAAPGSLSLEPSKRTAASVASNSSPAPANPDSNLTLLSYATDPTSGRAAVSTAQGSLWVTEPDGREVELHSADAPAWIEATATATEAPRMAVATCLSQVDGYCEAGQTVVRNTATGAREHRVPGGDAAITAVALSQDGSRLLTGDRVGRVELWSLEAQPEPRREASWVVDGWVQDLALGSKEPVVLVGDERLRTLVEQGQAALEGRFDGADRLPRTQRSHPEPSPLQPAVGPGFSQLALSGGGDHPLRIVVAATMSDRLDPWARTWWSMDGDALSRRTLPRGEVTARLEGDFRGVAVASTGQVFTLEALAPPPPEADPPDPHLARGWPGTVPLDAETVAAIDAMSAPGDLEGIDPNEVRDGQAHRICARDPLDLQERWCRDVVLDSDERSPALGCSADGEVVLLARSDGETWGFREHWPSLALRLPPPETSVRRERRPVDLSWVSGGRDVVASFRHGHLLSWTLGGADRGGSLQWDRPLGQLAFHEGRLFAQVHDTSMLAVRREGTRVTELLNAWEPGYLEQGGTWGSSAVANLETGSVAPGWRDTTVVGSVAGGPLWRFGLDGLLTVGVGDDQRLQLQLPRLAGSDISILSTGDQGLITGAGPPYAVWVDTRDRSWVPLPGLTSEVHAAAISPDDQTLVVGEKDWLLLYAVPPPPDREPEVVALASGKFSALAWLDSDRFVAASWEAGLTLHHRSEAWRPVAPSLPFDTVNDAIVLPSGEVAISTMSYSGEGVVAVLDDEDFEVLLRLPCGNKDCRNLAVSEDGRWLAVHTGGEQVRWWDLSLREEPAAALALELEASTGVALIDGRPRMAPIRTSLEATP